MKLSQLLTFLALCLPLRAAVRTAASASRADVGTAYALCVDGDTLAIPAGTGPWHTSLAITKAIILQGAGIGSTILIDDNMNVNSQQLVKWTTEAGKTYRMTGIEFRWALRDVTGSAATNVITCTGHELVVNDVIRFVSTTTRDPDDIALVGGAGITAGTTYYVKTAPTANTFTISATLGGAELDFTTDITAGQWYRPKTPSPYDKGIITAGGFSSAMRIDNCKFHNIQNINIKWTSPYGVIDHCTFTMNSNAGFRVLDVAHRGHTGVNDSWGDIDWETPINWTGDRKACYVEDCVLEQVGASGTSQGGFIDASYGGGRIVFRYNAVTKGTLQNHGTESGTRYRGGRMIEAYGNTFDSEYIPAYQAYVGILARSGTVIAWNNRFTGVFNSDIRMDAYRAALNVYPWGIADGTKAWDTPDLTDGAGTPGGAGDGVFEAGTSTAAGSKSLTDSSKVWTTNQWAQYELRSTFPFTASSGSTTTATVAGAAWTVNEWAKYEFTRNSDNAKGVVVSNTADTLTFSSNYYLPNMTGGGAFVLSISLKILSNTSEKLTLGNDTRVFRSGAAYEIRLNDKVLDDSGLGLTTPIIGTGSMNINHQSLNQGMDQCYMWDNLTKPTAAGAWSDSDISDSVSIKENRNWYNETVGAFDGTVGVGVGTLAARPATCTTGVGYWATDQGEWNSTNGATADGQLYVATATNTWGLHYKPYTYPHPLTSEEPVTPDTTAPTLFSTTIENNGTTVTLVFSENVASVNSAHYTMSSGALSAASGAGPSWTMTLSPVALSTDAARTIAYTAGTTVDTATTPNALATFSGAAVTNNSIQTSLSIPRRLRLTSSVGAQMTR